MPSSTPSACADTGCAVLRVRGDDAIAFLHGQLSSDVRSLSPGDGQYWSYNSAKGRTLANGVLWRSPPGSGEPSVTMLVAADLAELLRRRLSMYVLRAKVAIDDVTAASTLIGLAGEGAVEAAHDAFGIALRAGHVAPIRHEAVAFMLPAGRIVIVGAHGEGAVLQAALARHARHIGNDEWRWSGIAAGVPWIGAATSDLFVPQMLNLDLIGAISFRKGCYPGQEIVARMQYLGRLKERLFAFDVDALDVAPATRLYSATFGAGQACGTVVNAAPDPSRGSALLAVVQLAAVDAGDLVLGAPDGPALARRALPYDVP